MPFDKGEIAYTVNPNSTELTTSAIEFIESQMKEKEPRQVRWAMLYLGKHKIEAGIPVLLKYLDYQYTTTPVVAEAFPALRALIEIGQPAGSAAWKLLAHEENNPQRLELLVRLFIGIKGPEEGKKLIEGAIANLKDAKDAAHRQLLKAALTKVLAQSSEAPKV